MKRLISYYLLQNSLYERRRLILTYPILLSSGVEQLIEKIYDELKKDEALNYQQVREGIDLVRRCRQYGAAAVFPEAFASELRSLPRASDCEMVLVPAGKIELGSKAGEADRHEKPRKVHLEAFSIDKFPVTNADYGRFILETGYPIPK